MDARERVTDYTLSALERANAELRRENTRLAREKLGTSDAAAASILGRLQRAQTELSVTKARLAEYEQKLADERARNEWVDHLHAQIEELKAQIEAMRGTRAWRVSSSYWRLRRRLLRHGRPEA